MFECKIQNASKVIAFTRNHTDDADNGTKNNVTPPPQRGGRHSFTHALIPSFNYKLDQHTASVQ